MYRIIPKCGPAGYLLLLISTLVLFYSILFIRNRQGSSLFLLPLLGVLAAMTGFLGQATGIFNSLTVIINAESINPQVVSEGLFESFYSTWWGITLLIYSSVFWLIFKGKVEKNENNKG